ncbi:CD8A protein, partial [Upupa epops]|nr:CD8A protein [Upupa epops]
MDVSSALLLLLSLGLCCARIRGQRLEVNAKLRYRSTRPLQLGERLELECQSHTEDSGVFWIRQDKGGNLHFIIFISSLTQGTFERKVKTSTHFEVARDGKFYWLAVKSFKQQDEGNYFCLVMKNQALSFSTQIPVFFP